MDKVRASRMRLWHFTAFERWHRANPQRRALASASIPGPAVVERMLGVELGGNVPGRFPRDEASPRALPSRCASASRKFGGPQNLFALIEECCKRQRRRSASGYPSPVAD
jgi:hypothetical protein